VCDVESISRRAVFWAVACALGLLAWASDDEAMPRFKAKTLDGETFTNESVKGKVVLLQFWATWCQYCRRDQPAVDTIAKEFADKGLVVLAVNMGEPKRTVMRYLDDSPRACRIVLMEDTNLAALYASRSYPLYVLIDRGGNVAGTRRGAGGEEALRSLLKRAGLSAE